MLACGIFGSVSGSSAATCATVAKIALPELKRRGYDETVSLGSLAGAGTLGILIPPSITMVVYAVAANVSIIQVFLAGFLPGLLVMALYSGYIAVWSLLHPERTPPPEPRDEPCARSCGESREPDPASCCSSRSSSRRSCSAGPPRPNAPPGACSARSLIAWWSGSLSWESFWQSVMGTTRITCMIMLILAGASFMSTSLAYTGIPLALAAWVEACTCRPTRSSRRSR